MLVWEREEIQEVSLATVAGGVESGWCFSQGTRGRKGGCAIVVIPDDGYMI